MLIPKVMDISIPTIKFVINSVTKPTTVLFLKSIVVPYFFPASVAETSPKVVINNAAMAIETSKTASAIIADERKNMWIIKYFKQGVPYP